MKPCHPTCQLTYLKILLLWLGWCAGCGLSAQNTLFLPYDATSLTDELKSSMPERLAYPTDLKNTIGSEVEFVCTQQTYIPHPFSVSHNRQVLFSPGNLQYNAALGTHLCADGSTQQGTWRFAEHQWDYVGDAENGTVYHNGEKCDNSKISSDYDGWIDLFGWGTSGWNSGAKEYQPWATGKANDDYITTGYEESDLTGTLALADWGMYNEIDGDTPGTWRSLTKEESYYLLVGRAKANQLFGFGTVNNIIGLILLPDEWNAPSEVTFASGSDKGMEWDSNSGLYNSSNDHFADNVYTGVQWQKMENAGAVFLPAAGYRRETTGYSVRESGNYWLASYGIRESSHGACYMNFPSNRLYPERHHYRYNGGSVRLVKDQTPPPPSAYIPQPFSISADRKILFSSGNLQYNAALGTHQCADGTTQQGTWRFAEHQWDFVGDAENGTVYHNGEKCDNSKISSDYDGWIDLFGWGTSGWDSGANAYRPYSVSTNTADYTPGGNSDNDLTGPFAYADWGIYNQIGSDAPCTWRTLSKDEWVYLFYERDDATNLLGLAVVNGINGLIILPDRWNTPEGLAFISCASKGATWNDLYYTLPDNDSYEHNTYTAAQWSVMEASGAVFLPAAGGREQTTTLNMTTWGVYLSNTHCNTESVYYMGFRTLNIRPQSDYYNRLHGYSVRLIKDYSRPTYNPKPFSVSADRQVLFSPGNLQYNAAQGTHQCADGTTQQGTWRFAEHQWDYVGDAENGTVYHNGEKCDNSKISSDYDGWIDMFGWGTSGWNSGAKEFKPYGRPVRKVKDLQPFSSVSPRRTEEDDDETWDNQDKNIIEEPKDTVCRQSSYRFYDFEYPLPEATDYEDRKYIHYTLEYFDKDACTRHIKDITITNKESHDTVSIFTGGTYQWNGQTFTESGNYSFHTTDNQLCDSTAWLHLIVRDKTVIQMTETATLCDGDHIYFYGEILTPTISQEYTHLITGDEQDTLMTLTLNVFPRYEDIFVSDTVTNGSTYQWEGHTYSEAGEYPRTYQSLYGCDSVVTLRLTDNKVEILSATCNDLCAEENALHIRLDYKGTAHSVRITFDSAAQASGWRDTLIAMPKDGDIVIPVRGRAGQFTCFAELLFRDMTADTVTVPFTLPYPSSVLKQRWNDCIAVLMADYNGGYDFVAFQWYENSEPLAGETGSVLYKQLVMGNQYSVLLTEANGMQLFSCPLTVTQLSAIETPQTAIRLHPTVANPLQTVHCQSDQPASLTVYDVQGTQTGQYTLPAGHSTFPAPAEAGLYLLLLHSLPSGKATTAKLIVIPN